MHTHEPHVYAVTFLLSLTTEEAPTLLPRDYGACTHVFTVQEQSHRASHRQEERVQFTSHKARSPGLTPHSPANMERTAQQDHTSTGMVHTLVPCITCTVASPHYTCSLCDWLHTFVSYTNSDTKHREEEKWRETRRAPVHTYICLAITCSVLVYVKDNNQEPKPFELVRDFPQPFSQKTLLS